MIDFGQQFLNYIYENYSERYFSLWRILFGVYLLYYNLAIFPYLATLYSNEGIYRHYDFLPFFPNLFALSDGVYVVHTLGLASVLLSFCILLGWRRNWSALLLWFVLTTFYGRNLLTEHPALPFIGLLLILLAIIPSGEWFSLDRKYRHQNSPWIMPYFAYFTALVVLGAGYSLSGYDKFLATGWQIGDAIGHMYTLPIAFDYWLTDLLREQPFWLIQMETWAAAGAQFVSLPFLLWRPTRKYMWLVLTAMFTYVLFVFDLTEVILGMLLFHLFLFDPSWVSTKGNRKPTVLWYDTNCKLCTAYANEIKRQDESSVTTFKSIYDYPEGKHNETPNTIIVEQDGKILRQSEAVIAHLKALGGVLGFLAMFMSLVPRAVRDATYDFVGRHRYRWFGRIG